MHYYEAMHGSRENRMARLRWGTVVLISYRKISSPRARFQISKGKFPAMTAMKKDFLQENRCNFLLSNDQQTAFLPLSLGVRKGIGITEFFDRG